MSAQPDETEVAMRFSPLAQAREAAKSGRPELATAWALISIAEDVTEIRRDLHWSIRRGGRSGG